MTFRQIILFGIGLFMCALVADGVYIYYHPAIASTQSYLLFKILLCISFGIGGIYTVWSLKKNITSKLKLEQRAIVQEGRYRKIVEESGITTIATDVDGVIRFVSKNVEKLCGYTPDEMRGLHVTQCMPTAFRDRVNLLIDNAASDSEYNTTVEIQIFTKQRVDKWIACRLYNIADDDGKLKEIQFMIWDNDYSKLLELELKALEESRIKQQKLLQDVVDNNPNLIYIKNLQGNYVLTNKRMREMSGMGQLPQNATATDYFSVSEGQVKLYAELDHQLIQEKQSVSIEDSFMYNGEVRHFYVTKFPMLDNNGDVEYICGVSVDVSELKNAQLQMHEAREEAVQAKAAQENFLANMSHEIRTPMNGVMGMSNLLLDTTLDAPQKEYVQSIKESAENLLSIINDLLDFSKIKSGKFHIDDHDFNIADTVKKAIYPLQVKAQEKNIALNCFIDTAVPETVMGDALRLQQMIINLTGNAVKFTQEGSVTIKVYPGEAIDGDKLQLCVEVADTGIGIPEDKLEHVFELYSQSDKNTSRIYGGTGLGLAIVKQLAELQSGTVTVTSELGKGSVFTIQIPYLVKSNIAAKADVAISDKTNSLLTGIRVLVAEDNIINQKVVFHTLKKQGADITLANNGKEAVACLKDNNYDLVLMDLQMPEMDGYQATRYIRRQMQLDIPIIAMTADAMKGESDKCIEAGMQDYISKPFEPKDLFAKILSYAVQA